MNAKRLLTTMTIVLSGYANVMAQKVTIDKITYNIDKEKGEAYVYEADKDIKVAVILSSVEYKGKSYPVTRISRPYGPKSKLSVEKYFYGGYAFCKCNLLESVSIPTSVNTIEYQAFYRCENLTNINIPNSVTSINSAAFQACGLQEISIPNSVTSIGAFAFEASKLKKISIPNSVKIIGKGAFATTPLQSAIVPDSPIEIYLGESYNEFLHRNVNESSFADCSQIKDVRCQNGSFPTWILPYLPEKCPFMVAYKYQQPDNNNMYAQNVPQATVQQPVAVQEQPKAPSSDVDVNLPSNATNNENTFAVIFANENYQEEVKVDYALNDGEVFKEYCQKVLGLPEDNIHIRKDATLNNIKAEMTWLQKVAEAYKGQARFIIYYAGHGVPDEASGTSYLLPVDGKGSMLETGYSLKQFYTQLGEMPSAGVTVFMDACFSGSKRGDGMLASARGVAIKARPQAPQGKMVVFSAAQGDETAYPFMEKEHGMFTYFLLKKLKETKGNVTLGELGQFITDQVSRKSIVSNGKSQTPSVVSSGTMGNAWKSMKLR